MEGANSPWRTAEDVIGADGQADVPGCPIEGCVADETQVQFFLSPP